METGQLKPPAAFINKHGCCKARTYENVRNTFKTTLLLDEATLILVK